jgi:hypothetical protein
MSHVCVMNLRAWSSVMVGRTVLISSITLLSTSTDVVAGGAPAVLVDGPQAVSANAAAMTKGTILMAVRVAQICCRYVRFAEPRLQGEHSRWRERTEGDGPVSRCVLTAFEAQTGTHTWRNTSPASTFYFRFLAANGYKLSDVEERACSK